MNLNEINGLAEDPGSVSWSVKSLALAVIMLVILFLGYKLVIVDEMDTLASAEQKEQELRQTFETRQKRASQLPLYQAQLGEMQRVFGDLLRQLPSDVEIPGLILDISEKGLSNGLELELFEPGGDVMMDFYAEKPIKIIAHGSYRELATFVSDIAGLPRIVTINDIDLKPGEKNDNLRMEAMVRTYRYLDDSVDAPAATSAAGAAPAAGTDAKKGGKAG
ncbi:MAG: type 4a pilus biogenesis protein PilO [Thiothrix sp.]|uniref:type 4a pilus biogenesis protein PilO n=1 Tax=Thiothrix sp. TaxID=1032 RepID=UPI002620A5CF|nr:type 4a pilus biogenesis protein PilO [Thiothrix sp.]MDD5392137.1 type 4a pilus biogenesis protein PilO [Thiothrix sp.]